MGLDKSKSARTNLLGKTFTVPLLVLSAALVIMLLGDVARESLRYDRLGIAHGQVWRLFSGHFSHLTWSHFALNGVGFVLIWTLVGARYSNRVWLLIIAITLATIDLGFWFLNPELAWYVGLSGLLHGMLAAGLVARLRSPDAETIVLAALLTAKLVWEQFAGALPGSEATTGGTVIVAAHLYGALGGTLAALLCSIRVRPPASI